MKTKVKFHFPNSSFTVGEVEDEAMYHIKNMMRLGKAFDVDAGGGSSIFVNPSMVTFIEFTKHPADPWDTL